MEVEISQQLQDKLKIIEKETDFFSHKPVKPVHSQFAIWVVIALIVASAYFIFTTDDKGLFLFFLAMAGVQFVIYAHQKKLYEMYSDACEIIKFYKQSEENNR